MRTSFDNFLIRLFSTVALIGVVVIIFPLMSDRQVLNYVAILAMCIWWKQNFGTK